MGTTSVAHAPCLQDETYFCCGTKGPAQEADSLQGCPSLLPTGEPQRLRNKGVRPGSRKPQPGDSYRLLQTRRSIPYSLRAFAQAVPSAWVTLPLETCALPPKTSCRSLLKCHLLREATLTAPHLKLQPPDHLYTPQTPTLPVGSSP